LKLERDKLLIYKRDKAIILLFQDIARIRSKAKTYPGEAAFAGWANDLGVVQTLFSKGTTRAGLAQADAD
jgi:hypothetical protein